MNRKLAAVLLALAAAGAAPSCNSMYYGTMEAFGVHKREIFVDRVEAGRKAQQDAKEQFASALEAFKAATKFEGGKLEATYRKLNGEYESCESRVEAVRSKISGIEDVSEALFDEWRDEIGQMQNADLKRKSESNLKDTEKRYGTLIAAMKNAESKMAPVLVSLRDHVLYLKHNLNAQAIASLQGDLGSIESDVGALIGDMQKAIAEADAFIAQLEGKPKG
jgi:predicted  nucleic acid-binding Zn-ribbon protein